MALTKTQVSELYVAIYNRASEGEGNTYWQSREGSQADIANAMLATDPAQTYFGSAVDDNNEFIQHIYLNTLGRTLADDPEGIAFWTARLDGGQSKGDVVVAIIESLKTQTPDSSAAHAENYQYFLNRVAVSNYAADQTPEPFPAGFDYDKMLGFNTSLKVTNDPATLEEAKKIVDSIANPGNVFTLTENMSEGTQGTADITEVYWGYNPQHKDQGGIPLSELVEFLTTITGLDLAELGLIDDDGVGPFDNVQDLQLSFGDVSANRGSEVTIIFNDGTSVSAEAQLGDKYFDFLSSLLFDENGNSRLFEKVVVEGQGATDGVRLPIVLTPTQNNGGTEEYGFTTAGDDLIVAGRLDLLHGAYIDGGSGINTLEIDAKGFYAQPKELLNIQHVKIENLPNVYTNADGSSNYPDMGEGNDQYHDSIIDLSRAGDIETLTLTEGRFGIGQDGTLTVAGIRNGALTRFEGGFEQDVTLHYGEGLTGALNIELAIGVVTADINLLHNASTLNIDSQGTENNMQNFFAGNGLTHLNISGEAIFSVASDLSDNFVGNRPAVIDASANTGGVDLTINGHKVVNFTGTAEADDSFTATRADVVTINAGDGNNTITTDYSDVVTITTGEGNDVISSVRGESVTIDAGNGDNEITVSAETMAITTGAGNDTVVVSGMGWNDLNADGNLTALINIDTGAGDDTVVLGRDLGPFQFPLGIVALEGSSITGENITLYVENPSDLRAATLAGIERVVINHDMSDRADDGLAALQPSLTLTASQFMAIGAENFDVEGSIFNTYGQLKIIVDQDMNLSTLVISTLPHNLDLQLEINNGVTLTMTAQQLHEWVAPNGVTLANQGTDILTGKVEILSAGRDFDPFNTNDQVKSDIDGKIYYGGSLSNDFMSGGKWYNVKLDAAANGYDRPADVEVLTRYTLDTDLQSEHGAFSTWHTYLRIIGDDDFVFNASEEGIDDWGQYNPGGSAIEIGKSLTGNQEFVIDFSKLEGQLIDLAVARFEDAEQVWGNGTSTEPARLNVELTGNVGSKDEDGNVIGGLFSRDVQTYVVTDLNSEDREFTTSQPTQDLENLGLRGNYDNTISFLNTERGVEFLLEVAYDKQNGYVVGTLNGDFARPGANAVFNVEGLQDLPDGEVQKVAGIITNASTATVNVEGGNTVIESFVGQSLLSVTLTSADDVTLSLDNASGANSWTAIDASDVEGDMILSLDGAFNFSTAQLTDIDAVILADGAALTLTLDQADDIGAGNFTLAQGATAASLNLSGLAEQEFALANYADGISVEMLELADLPVITLHPNTDLSGISALNVHEGTVLNLTAAQFQQLAGAGVINGVDSTSNFTVNITDLTQADVEGGFNLSGISADNVTVTLAEDVQLAASDSLGTLANTTIEIGDLTLTLAQLAQANGLAVNGDAGSALQFTAINGQFVTIDASGFNVNFLRITDLLVSGNNVDYIFANLPASVTKVIYNGVGDVAGRLQNVVVEESTTIFNNISFNEYQLDSEITHLTLNLEGGTRINGDLVVSTVNPNGGTGVGLIPYYLQQLVINSSGDAANHITGNTANVIDGDITPLAFGPAIGMGSRDNNLKDVLISADQNLVITGSIVFNSHGEDDAYAPADGISANNDSEVIAKLTIEGSADVNAGTLDTSDGDVIGLDVVNNGTGVLSATLNEDNMDAEDVFTFTGTGEVQLTVEGQVDLSSSTLDAVSQITLADGADLTLSHAQYDALGAAGLIDGGSAGSATLHLVEFDGAVVFDATALADGINVATITMAAGTHTLDAATDLTDVGQIIVPEGGVLNLTAAQFQQLEGNGSITGAPGNAFTVNITDLTQADVDAGFDLTGVTAENITITLGEASVDLGTFVNGALAANSAAIIGDADFVLADGQTLGLVNVLQASGLDVDGGANTTIVYKFADLLTAVFPQWNQIDASGYSVTVLKALAASFSGLPDSNVEFSIDDLPSSVELRLYEDPQDLGFLAPTHRRVVIEEGITTPNGLIFNDWDSGDEVLTLHLTLEGGVTLSGDLTIPTRTDKDGSIQRYFDTLTLVSEGDDANTITGNIDTGASFGPTTSENNLLNVVIEANQDLVIEGTINFNSRTVSTLDAVAKLTVTGAGDVTIKTLDTTDIDIGSLNIDHTGTGTLTITGGSDALELNDTESLIFTGTGNIVLDTSTGFTDNGIDGDELSVIDASGLTGDLSLGLVENIDNQDFKFTSGTGVTTMTLVRDTLNADVAGTPAETGWTFDFTNAAANSEFHIGDGTGNEPVPTFAQGPLNILLGANTTLYINEGVMPGNILDLTDIDLDITGDQAIVLADGVTLILTAEQASGLNIIGGADSTGTVNIVDLDNDQVYDFSGIAEDIAGTITLRGTNVLLGDDPVNDVTVEAATDLGHFSITLQALADSYFSLAGQTIRFNTVDQAERAVIVTGDGPIAGNSTNVVWLFDTITGPVDTSGYFQIGGTGAYAIGRLLVTEELINNFGGDVEQLFTTLPTSILRVDFTDVTALEVLLDSLEVHRKVELVHFTTLNDVTFSDLGIDPVEHIHSLELHLGGEVTIGNILLDDAVNDPNYDPASVSFDTLTIWSQLAIHQDHLLASEYFVNNNNGTVEPGEHLQPDHLVGNTIGDISVGAGLDLLAVNLNTLSDPTNGVDPAYSTGPGYLFGSVLNIGTLTFGARTANASNTPVLDVSGANDINITSVIATDAELAGPVTVINNLVGAALTAPGASPGIVLGAQIEELIFQGNSISAVTNLGSADPLNPNAGVSGSELSKIDASGYAGALHLGILGLIDGTNDVDSTTPAFTLTTGTGITTATLDKDPDSTDVPTLAAGSEWIFDYATAAAGSRLTITDAVVFEAPVAPATAQPKLTLKKVDLYIDGDVDLTGVVLDLNATTIYVEAGNTLTLTVEQATLLAGLQVQGKGTVLIAGEVDTDDGEVALNLANIQTVGIDLSGITDTGVAVPQANLIVTTLATAGALDDDGAATGFNVVGTAFNDRINGSTLDDIIDGGAGNDVLNGGTGSDTYLVTAGTDTIEGLNALLGDAVEKDVLVVSAGATANAAGIVAFNATADTVNNGTANLSTVIAGGTIDVSQAGGANGFNLVGSDGEDTLIGSANDDVITGGTGADVLTGGLGADTFFFGITKNSPAAPTITVDVQGVDQEIITITASEVGYVTDNEYLAISYSVNGVAVVPPVLVDLRSPGVDTTDADAVATAVAAHLNNLAGITATAVDDVVTVAGENGNALTISSVAPLGFTSGGTFAASTTDGTDVAHVVDLEIPAGTALGGDYVLGDFIKLTVTLAGGAEYGVEYTVNNADGVAHANVVEGLVNAFNLSLPGSTVVASFTGNTIRLTDDDADNGAFTVAVNVAGGVTSVDTSELGAVDPASLDLITHFVSGTDKVSFEGLVAGSGTNYVEAANVASYATALADADTAFNGTVIYYLSSYTEGTEDVGVLFFDANGDGNVDGAVKLTGITEDNFAFGDIMAG